MSICGKYIFRNNIYCKFHKCDNSTLGVLKNIKITFDKIDSKEVETDRDIELLHLDNCSLAL